MVRRLVPGRVLDRGGTSVGMCFEVSPRILVTAYGVLDIHDSDLNTPVVVLAPDGKRVRARVRALDGGHDLAVLEAEYPLQAMGTRLANSDNVRWGTRVWVGDVKGRWRGTFTRDGTVLRLGLVDAAGTRGRGMGGAPVVRKADGAVIGVLSHRYNMADARRDAELCVTRTEDLRKVAEAVMRDVAAEGSRSHDAVPAPVAAPQSGSRQGRAIDAPNAAAPDTIAPDTMAPDTIAPDTIAPDTMAEECAAPDLSSDAAMAYEDSPAMNWEASARTGLDPADVPIPEQGQRWLGAEMPAVVPLGSDVSLLVRIAARPPGQGVSSTGLKSFQVAPGGTRVAIIVQAPRELTPVEPLEQAIQVPGHGDSEPVRFAFRAGQPGLFAIRISAFAGGSFLGELVTELSVADGVRSIYRPPKTAALAPVQAEPGEVTLQVRYDGEQYTFQLLSESYLFEPVIASALTAKPGEAVERAVATLRAMTLGGAGFTAKNARTWMEETGIGLWNDMVPGLIKEQFWQLRGSIGSFSIACGQDAIPWELLYPLSRGQEDAGFLVEQFPVLRRVYGQCRTRRVSVGPPLFVVPDGSPSNAGEEVDALRGLLSDPGSAPIRDLEPLLALINSGEIGMLHFACHSRFSAAEGGSSITMGGGPFVPKLLNRAVTTRSLVDRGPLVFINACRSAADTPEYTRLMGWAGQFMAAGAGAFAGTLWAVRSSSALTFAEAFYGALLDGRALGPAALAARRAIAGDAADPTWLAYTVYGDPVATAAGAAGAAGASHASH